MDIIKSPEVADVFNTYPDHVRPKMMNLRQLILDTALKSEIVTNLDETLSWGEPVIKPKPAVQSEWIGNKIGLIIMPCTLPAQQVLSRHSRNFTRIN